MVLIENISVVVVVVVVVVAFCYTAARTRLKIIPYLWCADHGSWSI